MSEICQAEKEVLLERGVPLAMTRSMCPQAQVNVPWAFVKTSDNKEMNSTGKRKLKLKQTEAIQMGKVGFG